jgi:hypothetical protein
MTSRPGRPGARRLAGLLGLAPVLALCALLPVAAPALAEEDKCASAPNPIVCENALPGTPPSEWQVEGVGSPAIQGYATSMSVDVGQTESFKIDTESSSYHINILRLGYYGGDGARLVAANIKPTATLPQKQPACLTSSATGLIDCGNWGVSASWAVPSTAVSGVYIALLVSSNGDESQIPFVVRNDASHSEILLQTSDATWEAYNDYGGNSLYTCTVACPPGEPEGYKAAYAVSYNRPFDGSFAVDGGASYLYYAEYQMMYWLEENGYNVSYTSESEVDHNGALLKNHKVFISSGHDEYWSEGQRANVEAALAAGVNLAFFSGNELFWKTRWGPSTEGTNTPYRTLISYKETHFNKPVDPEDPPTWTGAWRDPRFSPPANGGKPENALTGQYFIVNTGTADITVPYQYSKLRLWRNTAASTLRSGQSLTLAPGSGTLGYEWDEDIDNGFRPAGEFDLSATTVSGVQTFKDYGSNLSEDSTATHHLTMYRAPSGALVFGAGTVQWSWGLADVNAWDSYTTEPSGNPPDPNMEQATVNLLAEMEAQPGSLSAGLVAASKSTNRTPPTSTITSPEQGATLQDGSTVTIAGGASAASGSVVAGVEVSTNGGSTWHPATLSTPAEQSVKWSYSWVAHGNPSTNIKSRAVDDSANLETPSAGVTVKVSCPCSIWGAGDTPSNVDGGDPSSTEVGVKFTSEVPGTISGLRFYKAAANTGTHVGSLWTASGTLLASATFTGETASGWQQVNFSAPVAISANTTYVASYLAPNGHYSADPYYFYNPPPLGGNALNSPPLHAVPASDTTTNGLYAYSTTATFPTSTYNATNYYVDPVFSPYTAPGQVTGVSATAGTGSATVSWSAPSSGGLVTTYTITPYIGSTAQTATTLTGSPPETKVTISGLTPGDAYTFTVQASNPGGAGAVSAASNAVTPAPPTAPGTPTGVSASAATSEALVSWSAPSSNGGSAITGYVVTPYAGAVAQTPVNESASATSATLTGLTNGTSYTFTVAAKNAIGTSSASPASGAVTPQDTIFNFATPTVVDSGDSSSVELGVKFKATVAGTVTGIRFYKAATNTGTHVGSLWTASGAELAAATFTGETASGWQQVAFSSPVAINAGSTYVAAYFAPNGHYSAGSAAFSSAGVENPPLDALANGTSENGVYNYSSSSSFPSSSFNATNYYVDVTFLPSPPPPPPAAPTGVSASPATSQAQVSWTAPSEEGGGPITSYTVTPYIGTTAQTPVKVSAPATSATLTGLQNGTSYTFTVAAANAAAGTGKASQPSSAVTPEDTIFDFATPAVTDAGDPSSIELGLKFTSAVNGSVTGIRFYKAATNTGTHIGSLWTAEGTLLSSATFTSETASGWQDVTFSTPVTITAGSTYVAGYFAPNGHYSATGAAFSSAGFENPPLEALANGIGVNGVYAYSATSTFPSNSYNATNYWVDVLFAAPAASPPGAPTGVVAKPATSQAQVSWTPPSGNGGSEITGYTVTPYVGASAQTPVNVGASSTSTTVAGLTNGTSYTFTVAAKNAAGTGSASQASAAVTPRDTIFNFATPTILDTEDSSSVELGVKFTAAVNGSVTGIRFYKAPANTGTHIGSLWSAGGTQLAAATFTGETASGWQEVNFAEPVAITAGTTYVAAYLAPNGHYSATAAAFSSAGIENPPLDALANGTSVNGVYAYSTTSTFPANSYNSTNYYVDVMFAPGS